MKVAFCTKQEFFGLTPDENTVVISLLGNTPGVKVEDLGGWKAALSIKFDVLSPEGPRGEFKPIDDQARRLATQIFPYVNGCESVIVFCEYAEIRSPAVALGIAYSRLNADLFQIVKKKYVEPDIKAVGTFSGRTTGWISRVIDAKLKEERDNS